MKDNIKYYKCYVYQLGLAVYTFSYYETLIVDICGNIDEEFRFNYYRESSMTSGTLNRKLVDLIKVAPDDKKEALSKISQDFGVLIEKRNALIHAHPIYGNVLNYQTKINKKGINDYTWSLRDVEDFIDEIGTKINEAVNIKDRLS